MRELFKQHRDWMAHPVCYGYGVLNKTYYHFFTAVLLPLLDLIRLGVFVRGNIIHLISCGGFDGILWEVAERTGIDLVIHSDLSVLDYAERSGSLPLRHFTLTSFEQYWFIKGKWHVVPDANRKERLNGIRDFCYTTFTGNRYDVFSVLLIDREELGQGQGRDARSILNIDEIEHHIRIKGYDVHRTRLGGKSLAEQIALFATPAIVIAQHGAALVNLVWSQWSSLIEIVPPYYKQWNWRYFALLAQELGIPRVEIDQGGPHNPVDLEELDRALGKIKEITHDRR